ncbi:MAG: glycosyltransferase, partial [Betaproteobacteria bacterium]|nr:glycosyltransferase [Betaproteobacteria bacterium]
LALHADRDVVLLNSDTEVANDWLDRLLACAAANPHAASISPFSNNATLCSYPRIGESNPLPAGMSLVAVDNLFKSANRGQSVQVPTTVGFCMYLRRSVLNLIGLLDEAAFGRGYGEENDWCLRATAAGHTHLLCGNVFVYHRGEVSFGADASPGKLQSQAIIDARYPQYSRDIAAHFEEDPARPMRRAADIARLCASPLPRVLFVTHNWGGGTEKHVRDLASFLSGRAVVLVMRPVGHGGAQVEWLDPHEEFSASFDMPSDESRLIDFLRGIGVSRVHVHHIHGHTRDVLSLAQKLGVPLDVTLHDYFPLSPQYHLSPGGVIDDAEVENDWGLSLTDWRRTMADFFASAERVLCPSRDLASRITPYFPTVKFEFWPHPEAAANAPPTAIKVLVLGGLTVEKGLDVVRQCAIDAHERKLPLVFKILGHTEHALPVFPAHPLIVHGSYDEADLPRLIELERADAFLFPAQIPESFSFTLTAAMRTGLPVIASKLGSFPERLADYTAGRLVAWNATPAEWNAVLMDACPIPSSAKASSAGTSEAWAERYLAPVNTKAGDPPNASLPARYFYPAKHLAGEREKSLEQLYIGGIECGHGGTRMELKRRVSVFDAELAHARDSAEAAHDALHTREAELNQVIEELYAAHVEQEKAVAQAREAYDGILNTTSWRITAPLRSAVLRWRNLRHRLSDLRHGIKRLPRDAAMAGQILKEQGVVALGKRVHSKLTRHNDFAPHTPRNFALETAITPLTVPHSDKPRWSLIIPVYEQHLLTFTCLKSIAETCAGRDIEVIVIDDCSPTPAAQALKVVSGVNFVRNETNLGFLKNCNKAAAMAKGEFVVILNNDLILTGDWLDQMTSVFERFDNTGMVGAKLIYPDGKLQEAGGIVWRDGSAWNVGRGDDPDKPAYSYVREVDYCSGACLMLKRDFWNELGGFDEVYAPAYYEDTDLAFRVRQKGRRVIYQPHAVVVHFEGQSSGTDTSKGVKQYQVVNQKTFFERWSKVLTKHRVNGLSPDLERDRYVKRRVLVVDACMLTPDHDAGSLRMFELLGIMREMGCKVTFVADNLEFRQPYVQQIQAMGVEVLHHPYQHSIRALIEQQAVHYDVIMLCRASIAAQYVDLVKDKAPRAKLVFDTVDLHYLRMERQAELANDAALRLAAANMRKQELDIIAKSDLTLVVSPVEVELLEKAAPRAHVHIVSLVHVASPGPKPFVERSGLIFIGGYRHPPNLDAVTWYAENVLPIVRKKHPGIVTTIIGSNAPPALEKLAAEDFVIAGFVADVEPYYQNARLSISPLRYGAGVKGKVNLAMQYGVPVVATSISAEGMYLKTEENVLVADSAEAFADAVIRLHTDEALWNRLREAGLANIEANFSRNAARKALGLVLDL